MQLRATIDSQRIQDLADSMARVGQLQPLAVRPDGDRYTIKAGHRRFLAAQLLGWREIRCEVHPPDAGTDTAVSLHENLFREPLTPLEEAALCQDLLDEEHLDLAGIARRLRHKEEWVKQRLAIMTYPPDVLNAVHEDHIKIAAAQHIALIDDESYRGTVLDAATSHGMTERAAMEWKAQYDTYKAGKIAGGSPAIPTAAEIDVELQKTVCDIHGGQVYSNVTKFARVCFDCWLALQQGLRTPPTAG